MRGRNDSVDIDTGQVDTIRVKGASGDDFFSLFNSQLLLKHNIQNTYLYYRQRSISARYAVVVVLCISERS